MADSTIQSITVWQTRMAELALTASCAEASESVDVLRELHALLRGAPAPWAHLRASAGETGRFNAMLLAEACASAALLLITGRAGYMVSQGLGGRVMATVSLVSSSGEVSCEAADVSLALTGALAEALSGPPNETPLVTGHDERAAQRGPVSMRLN